MASWRFPRNPFGSLLHAAALALALSRMAGASGFEQAGHPDFSTLQVETVPLHVSAGQPFVLRVTVREQPLQPDPQGCQNGVFWSQAAEVSPRVIAVRVSYEFCPSLAASQADGTDAVTAVREWNVPGLAAGPYAVQFGDGLGAPFAETRLRVEAPAIQLALRDDRFLVFLERPDGATAVSASAARLTRESGYFSFFAPSNVEVTVKILDGRGVNGRFWVFAASMTDLPFTLTVVDTAGCVASPSDSQHNCPTRTYTAVAGENRNFIDTDAFDG